MGHWVGLTGSVRAADGVAVYAGGNVILAFFDRKGECACEKDGEEGEGEFHCEELGR